MPKKENEPGPPVLQVKNLSYAKGATTLLALSYYYKLDSTYCPSAPTGNDGQIQCIKDTTGTPEAGRSVTYTYDPLSRLSTAVTTGSASYAQWGLSWAYDKYGNRLNQTQTAGSPPTNSLSFASPSGGALTNHPDNMCFDANGNMLAETAAPCPSPTYVYDAENRLTTYMGTGGVYTYDGNGLRVKKVASSTTTVYIFSGSQVIAEYDNGAAVGSPSREYIYSGGQRIATIAGSTTTYLHPDHQSVRVSTDSTGTNVRSFGHYPYGETWYETPTASKWKFTTYERDSESTNDYAMAREYVNRFGRFLTTDPLSGDIADPQSLNRYTYVINDPTDLVDPSGQCYMSGYTGPNCNGLPDNDSNFGGACTIDGVAAACSMASHLLGSGSAYIQGLEIFSRSWIDEEWSDTGWDALFFGPGGGPGGPGNFVNRKALAECVQTLFGVKLNQFIESKQGTNGFFSGWGPDKMTNGGNDRNIPVTNAVNAYSGQQLTQMSNSISPGIVEPGKSVIGLTLSNSPYINYTANNMSQLVSSPAYKVAETQIHELGNSLNYITGAAFNPATVPGSDKDAGQLLENCVRNKGGFKKP